MAEMQDLPTIYDLYTLCLTSFRHFGSSLTRVDCRVLVRLQITVDEFREQYGKFIIWGEQSRAFVDPNSRGSLDEVVRNQQRVKQVIRNTLQQLAKLLAMATSIASISEGSDQDSESSLSDDSDSDVTVALDLHNAHAEHHMTEVMESRKRVSKISVIMRHISEQNKLLYSTAALLKRPSLSSRYLRSSRPEDAGIRGLEYFQSYDYAHICEKVEQWHRDWRMANEGDFVDDPSLEMPRDIPAEECDIPAYDNGTSPLLTKRLARANVRRRKQLQFWEQCPDGSRSKSMLVVKATPETIANPSPAVSKLTTDTSVDAKINASHELDDLGSVPSEVTRTVTSKVTFSTVAVSSVQEGPLETAPRTVYAESALGKSNYSRVPPVPKGTKTCIKFDCPFCGLSLDSATMMDRRKWKRHVFRDLRPYVCTFLECISAEKQYRTRHDWIHHESQTHRRQWVCPDPCQQTFSTEILMIQHIQTKHQDEITREQVSLVASLSDRPMDDETVDCCPLCPTKLPLVRLYGHIAEHLEEISLFVLPNRNEDSDGSSQGTNASNRALGDHDKRDSDWDSISYHSNTADANRKDDLDTSSGLDESLTTESNSGDPVKAPKDVVPALSGGAGDKYPYTSTTNFPDLVISVDFGMTSTGVAYCNMSTGSDVVRHIQTWPGRSLAIENRVPSLLAYPRNSSTPSSWGFLAEAEQETGNAGLEVRECIKIMFDETLREEMRRKARDPSLFPHMHEVEKWCTDYFRCLYRTIEARMMSELAIIWEDANIEYIFSVPATWQPLPTVERFRKVIADAGFGSVYAGHKATVGLTEAEAVVVHTAQSMPGIFKENEVLFVCDMEATSTTLSVCRVKNTSGGPLVLQKLDAVFSPIGTAQLGDLFEAAILKRLQLANHTMPIGLNSLNAAAWEMQRSRAFQNAKRDYGSIELLAGTETFAVRVPKLDLNYRNEQYNISGGNMYIHMDDLKDSFDVHMAKLFDLVQSLLVRFEEQYPNEKITQLILSGDLSSSAYVQSCFRAQYSSIRNFSSQGMGIRLAPDPQLNVCKGNIEHRLAKLRSVHSPVGGRYCPASYGTRTKILYDASNPKHLGLRIELDMFNGETYVTDYIDWLIKKGQPVSNGSSITRELFRKCLAATSAVPDPPRVFSTEIICSEADPQLLPYAIDSSCRSVCKVETDYSNIPLSQFKLKNRHFWSKGKAYHRISSILKLNMGPASLSFEVWCNGVKVSKNDTIEVEWQSAAPPTASEPVSLQHIGG